MIEYRGYTGVFEFDPTVDAFHGRVIGIRDVVTFEGRSLDDLRREMAESLDDYLAACAESGKEPERPYRGEFLVRTTPELHRAISIAAESAGMSLNAWVEGMLAESVEAVLPESTEVRKQTRRRAKRKVPLARGS